MPNWAYNHTAFVGPQAALDEIEDAITPEGDFDFNRLNPTPAALEALAAPANTISDEAFAEKYDLEEAPTTIDEFVAFANDFAEEHGHTLQDVPTTVHHAIQDTYGHLDWYNWRSQNWGTKWEGSDASSHWYHDNLLIVTYNTAWTPPEGVFSALRDAHEGLHIINGVISEGFFDSIDAYEGGREAFLAYFTPQSGVEAASQGEGDTIEVEDASEDCDINEQNIQEMIDEGVLIGEGGESLPISSIG